jgi:hypothetical protein
MSAFEVPFGAGHENPLVFLKISYAKTRRVLESRRDTN